MLHAPPPPPAPTPPPIVLVDRDNVAITTSCAVRIGDDVIEDADGNGVVQISGDGIVVDFGGATLHGSPASRPRDLLAGIGVRVTGRNVTVRNLRLDGFRIGVLAQEMHGGALEAIDVRRNFGQRLGSTTAAEDGADWLWPHRNDEHEWRTNYGAAVCVERSERVLLRRITVRQSQNGIVLDRVDSAQVVDNDCSFLSGWGLAMWRCNDNLVSRNAFDFCVRGYSHGVYNRGQDSAGILLFEQCCRNRFDENSATHGGDGLFGFAGREAIGEAPPPPEAPPPFHARRGCNDNVFVANDFSYAAAHGLELTFSFGNLIVGNRFVANAICGIWGGYSQETLIFGNRFVENGGGAYGHERGGVNIEHSFRNRIADNRFERNACGVALWWDANEGLLKLPWAQVNETGCRGNLLEFNTFDGDAIGIDLRASDETRLVANRFTNVANEVAADERSRRTLEIVASAPFSLMAPTSSPMGDSRPVGAREALAGRDRIIMTEWGPYDWASPMLVPGAPSRARAPGAPDAPGAAAATPRGPSVDVWRLLGPTTARSATVALRSPEAPARGGDAPGAGPALFAQLDAERAMIEVCGGEPGAVQPYELTVVLEDGRTLAARGMLVGADWSVRVFRWTVDPREDAVGWRREAEGAPVLRAARAGGGALDLPFGNGGPADLATMSPPRLLATTDRADEAPSARAASDGVAAVRSDGVLGALRGIGGDHFGTIATTTLRFPPGRFTIRTTSDDGIRVRVDGRLVVDDWTWHAPKEASAELRFDAPTDATIEVEHFELDGFATLRVAIEKAD